MDSFKGLGLPQHKTSMNRSKSETGIRQGGFVHIDNEDMLPDGNCSRLTIDGNMFVDSSQRPAAFDTYFQHVPTRRGF